MPCREAKYWSRLRLIDMEQFHLRRCCKLLFKGHPLTFPRFLKEVSDNFFDKEALMIWLKPKEKDLKIEGRYFALMTWTIREYFVITEYLIKEQILPLYQGMTMRDSMMEVLRKMMNCTNGQGLDAYEKIGIANHIDYYSWNNHMRKESTAWGHPNLFTATHKIFQESDIHYSERCDLLEVENERLKNATEVLACWPGQDEGLEGLQQKGWSL